MILLFLFIALVFSIGFTLFIFIFFKKQPQEVVEVFEEIRNPAIMQVLVPRENDKTPLASEQMFASLHGILRDSKKSLDFLSFEIISTGGDGIKFYVICPEHLVKFIEGQIYAQYPNAVITHTQDPVQKPIRTTLSNGQPYQAFVTAGEIELQKDFVFPIKTFRDFEVDPLAAITGVMGDLKEGEDIWLQMLVRPIGDYWQDSSKNYISAIREGHELTSTSGFSKFLEDMSKSFAKVSTGVKTDDSTAKEVVRLAPGQEAELSQIEEKMLKPGFEIVIRIVTRSGDQFSSEQLLRNMVASFKQFTTAHLNGFVYREPEVPGEEIYNRYASRYLPADPGDIVNITELASIFHLPNNTVETPSIHWSRASKAEPPLDLPLLGGDEAVTAFGETDYRGERMVFGLKREDRRRHMYLLGKTGVGKSSTFKNMIISDIMSGDGVCYIDPHGQDIDELLQYIPPQRIDDVVYFDPSDVDNPIGFNMLELKDLSQRDLVADGVVSVFKKQFEESWGPRLQYILQNTVATCIEAQNTTILAVQRMLIDKNYRKFVLKHVNDPILLKFWENEFDQMSRNSRLITEAVAPIQNKVGRFISSSVIRNIVGQVNSTIDLRDIMDNRKILLVNLAQGKIGEESAALLGGMFITRLQSTAMERVDIPEDQRTDFYLYVDEFQNFATDSFAKILSEARKFRLNLTMTNQYIEQIPLTVRNAIFGNVGTLSSFVVSQADASLLANEFAPIFDAEDLVSLESHSMYVKLCIDGMTSKPFSAKSLDYKVRLEPFGQKEKIVAQSREKYGVQRDEIEDKIRRWTIQTYSDKGNRSVMDKEETSGGAKGSDAYRRKGSRVDKVAKDERSAPNVTIIQQEHDAKLVDPSDGAILPVNTNGSLPIDPSENDLVPVKESEKTAVHYEDEVEEEAVHTQAQQAPVTTSNEPVSPEIGIYQPPQLSLNSGQGTPVIDDQTTKTDQPTVQTEEQVSQSEMVTNNEPDGVEPENSTNIEYQKQVSELMRTVYQIEADFQANSQNPTMPPSNQVQPITNQQPQQSSTDQYSQNRSNENFYTPGNVEGPDPSDNFPKPPIIIGPKE